jgi:hypothetical protein
MKDMILNFVLKTAGAGKLLNALDGKKAYVGGAGLMLGGAAMILVDLAPVLAQKNAAALLAFATSLPAHPGFQRLMEGLAVTGLRHAVAKS